MQDTRQDTPWIHSAEGCYFVVQVTERTKQSINQSTIGGTRRHAVVTGS